MVCRSAYGQAACRTASLIASAVTVAATAPSTVSAHVASKPAGRGGSGPDARQNTTSPSTGVNTGSTARAMPALATRATIAQLRLSSEASVNTHARVVFPVAGPDSARGARSGARGHLWEQGGGADEPAALVVRSAEGPPVLVDHVAEGVGDGDRAENRSVPEPGRRVAHPAAGRPLAAEQLPDGRAGAGPDRTTLRYRFPGAVTRGVALVGAGTAAGFALREVVHDRGGHERDRPHRGRSPEPALLEPSCDAVGRRQAERASAREQHRRRPLGVRERRERLDLARPGSAAADVHPAPAPIRRNHDRAAGPSIRVGPVADSKAGRWVRQAEAYVVDQ